MPLSVPPRMHLDDLISSWNWNYKEQEKKSTSCEIEEGMNSDIIVSLAKEQKQIARGWGGVRG